MFKFTKHSPIIFPVFDRASSSSDREIIQIFLQRYRDIEFQRDETRVLSAIQKTADLTSNSHGVIAKILIDCGLRAGRNSLPQDFLDHMDQSIVHGTMNKPQDELYDFWVDQGLSPFHVATANVRHHGIPSFVTAY